MVVLLLQFLITKKQTVFFARDRLGIKPLYYFKDDNYLIFSSELRAILKSGLVKKDLNPLGVEQVIRYQSSKSPLTIINNIESLKPGSYVLFDKNSHKLYQESYWKPTITAKQKTINYDDVIKTTRIKIIESVERRMVSDVDVAAFLSGGLDSSVIVAAMKNIKSSNVINTFSLVHDDKEYDESSYSDLIAKKYKTNHIKVKINRDEILSEIQNAIYSFDSPSSDGINNYLVSKKISDFKIKVAISGLGGDEIFGGYHQFRYWKWYNSVKGYIPIKLLSKLLKLKSFDYNLYYKVSRILDEGSSCSNFNSIIRDVSGYNGEKIFKESVSKNTINYTFDENILKDYLFSEYTINELNNYTSNVLLKDADQTSMAHGLELRVPFLDHELVEYSLSLKDAHKKYNPNKKLMIDAFKKEIPSEIYQRKKQGFLIPTDLWMKNELKKMSRKNLNILCDLNFFNSDAINQLWKDFSFNNSYGTMLWSLVVLGGWIEENSIYD